MNAMRSMMRLFTARQGVRRLYAIRCNEQLRRTRILRLPGVLFVALLLSTLVLTPQPVAAQSFQIFVPMVASDNSEASGEATAECILNDEEAAVAAMMESDSGQRRVNPICDPILSQVARARARDMALRGYFSHTNPDGEGPNLLVREAGYSLPDWYSKDQAANNIESIGAGYESANQVWQGWLASPSHRTHVLGTQSFYADQQAYGVGYYFSLDAPFKYYWVFISAPVAE